MKTRYIAALGVLVGNILFVPVISNRSFADGLAIGVISAILVLLYYSVRKEKPDAVTHSSPRNIQ